MAHPFNSSPAEEKVFGEYLGRYEWYNSCYINKTQPTKFIITAIIKHLMNNVTFVRSP